MSEHQPFVHLHVHSEFSLLDGLSRIAHLTERARRLNMPALALTDHGTMHGTIDFYRRCRKAGIKPILGVESYLAERRMEDRDPELDRSRYHLLLLAENQTGYQNLLRIVSEAQLHGFYYRPRTDRDYLAQHSEGLITTTGCLAGEIPQAILVGNMKKAHRLMNWYVDVFGRERFFVELQEHSIPELTRVNKTLIEMAGRYDLSLVATNDVHYTTAAEAGPHDVLLCIQTGKPVSTGDRMRMSDGSYYLKSHDEMAALFGEVPGALSNTLLIAEMCHVNPEPEGYHLPQFDVPEGYSPATYLRHLCEKGLAWRYGDERAATDAALRQRLDHELTTIHRMGFEAYFLIVWDLCEFARQRDIWWNVRGSGAGSLVAFTLGITGIDPLENGLIFERFLNPDRVSMPDIDLDYPDDRRHEMIEYTIHKYGSDKVAQIITFGTMGARAAIRDVGRVLEVPLSEVDGVAKLIPAIPGKPVSIENALDPHHEFFSGELARRYGSEETVRQMVDMARNLEGVARHASTHAAGVIISDRPLVEYAPLHRPTSGGDGEGIGVVTQWPMEVLESIGLLKVDFLGLSTLTVLRKAAELIEQRHGIRYNMENIPYDVGQRGPDPDRAPEALFEMLSRGDVAGVFQVEGAGMRRLMMQMRPTRFDHIIAAISLYRPGPMENIPEYVARMHGKKVVSYHHADLEPILSDTFGVLVYQEQIIRIAADIAGYAPGEADTIRKAVAKKKRDLMDLHRAQFIAGAQSRGYSPATAEAIWGDIEFFARYGFNKAHAADYAVITCQTAFLKAHYPVEYMTALLSVESSNTDKVAQYLAEARRMGITVSPPHINRADLDFIIEEVDGQPIIRFGLGAIKNTGTGALELILQERRAGGPLATLADLCERVDLRRVGKRALESMIKVGVFDEWGTRPQLLDALDRMLAHSAGTIAAAAAGQMTLFGGANGIELDVNVELLRKENELPRLDRREILNWEKELIGVYISEHPLTRYLDLMKEVVSATSAELDESVNGRTVAMLGLLTYLRRHVTKKGDAMAFGSMEDLQGTVELIFFPRIWKDVRASLDLDRVYLVRGTVRVDSGDRAQLIVESIENSLSLPRASGEPAPLPVRETLIAPPADEDLEPQPADGIEETWPSAEAAALSRQARAPAQRDDSPRNNAAPHPPRQGSSPAKSAAPPLAQRGLSQGKSAAPPPPPNFNEEDARWLRPAASGPAAPEVFTPSPGHGGIDAAPAPQAERRMVVVDIDGNVDWRETCRQIVAISGEYDGAEGLIIRLPDQKMAMSFPNLNTRYCRQLRRAMEAIPSIRAITLD
jgi:DNA polymerase III subunit alpha